MGARPVITDVALSTWGQPFAGAKAKLITIQGPYNGQMTAASDATSDTISVSADFCVYDVTTSTNVDSNATNFKDPA